MKNIKLTIFCYLQVNQIKMIAKVLSKNLKFWWLHVRGRIASGLLQLSILLTSDTLLCPQTLQLFIIISKVAQAGRKMHFPGIKIGMSRWKRYDFWQGIRVYNFFDNSWRVLASEMDGTQPGGQRSQSPTPGRSLGSVTPRMRFWMLSMETSEEGERKNFWIKGNLESINGHCKNLSSLFILQFTFSYFGSTWSSLNLWRK